MDDEKGKGRPLWKTIVIVIAVAVVVGLVATMAQHLLLGEASSAVTGGITGAISAMVFVVLRDKPGKAEKP